MDQGRAIFHHAQTQSRPICVCLRKPASIVPYGKDDSSAIGSEVKGNAFCVPVADGVVHRLLGDSIELVGHEWILDLHGFAAIKWTTNSMRRRRRRSEERRVGK